ncbi:hypothetical protein SAMN05421743_105221 [Thalassobacillus cyri]|uniref:Uncharacterized protein n=1 Tax=Thalassobacillus cyri TaxID=571932 RepID=A0A1H4C0W0_9BACI|nr:hypothetical protein [Thalassobacillus cyri]SEA53964.1 hypothetical protein SAMN05421743_105221 [Thalassobacillus cyri]
MNDIHKINSSEVVGGPGRLVWAPHGTDAPEKISDVMDLSSPYDLKGPWKDLGATNEGIAISRGFETEDIPVDQSIAPIDDYINGWTHSISTQLAQNTVENRQLSLIGSPIVETPPTTGTATTLTNDIAAGATTLSVTSAAEFTEGGWLQIGEEIKKVSKIASDTIYLVEPVGQPYTTTDEVTPITELGYKKIGYGAVEDRPTIMLALLNQKKDGTMYMAVFRKCKVAGDDKEQNFQKGTRYLPLGMQAFPEDGTATDENVYYEIEQVR